MPGPNLTGLPQTADYNLGRGVVYFAPLVASIPGPYRDLGNAPEFSISIEVETLEHQSSRAGLKVTDKEVVISQKVNLALTLDELNHDNLAVLFSGDLTNYDNASAIAGVTTVSNWITSLVLNQWYDITTTADGTGLRLFDIEAGRETFTENGASAINASEYTLDLVWGRVFFKSGNTLITGDGVDFVITADAGAKTVDQVRALTTTSVIGALKFISENPANNDAQTEFQFHQVSLKADGDFSLIGDEFTTMSFTAVAERNTIASALSPTMTISNIK